MSLTIPQIAGHARAAGFTGDALVMITAIALRESGGNPLAKGDKDNPHAGCNSWGLVQINVCPQGTPGGNNKGTPWREHPETLLDPAVNMRAAYEMSQGGKNFGPWSTYRQGIPAPDLARVRRELENAGPETPAASGSSSGSSAPPDPAASSGSFSPFDLHSWARILQVLGGAALLGFGVWIITRDVDLKAAATAAARGTMKPQADPDDNASGAADDAANYGGPLAT